MNDYDPYYDNPADGYDEPSPRRRSQRCACFSPGEVGGTCPGPENCPYAGDDDEIEGEED